MCATCQSVPQRTKTACSGSPPWSACRGVPQCPAACHNIVGVLRPACTSLSFDWQATDHARGMQRHKAEGTIKSLGGSLRKQKDAFIACIVVLRAEKKLSADSLSLKIGRNEKIMKVCRHFAVVHGGVKPHKAPFFPRGDHQRKSLYRPCQPCGVFRLLPLYRRKKSAEFLCRKLFVLRIFDHPLFLVPFFSCMGRRILQAAPPAAGITDRR